MQDKKGYDAIVVVTPADFLRVRSQRKRLVELLPVRRVLFVGNDEVGTLLEHELDEGGLLSTLRDHVGFLSENSILPFDSVHAVMNELGAPFREDGVVPRNFTGWYYQQFLKLAYADYCSDEYYMTWDGDTVPCKAFSMFSDTGQPYLDYKREFHQEYFTTMKRLLGLFKVIEPSFISEHMLFRCDLVHQLRDRIEANPSLVGESWWERILRAIRPEKLLDNSFSEFETYGTFVALTDPGAYRLREWHSFRYAAEFFDVDAISDKDYEWLGKDFGAASFEKNQSVREDNRNLFDNPAYQKKLSARQMLEAAQEVFQDGANLEKWDIPQEGQKNSRTKDDSKPARLKYLEEDVWQGYERLGDQLADRNREQAWLCYQNAAFLASGEEAKRLTGKMEQFGADKGVQVRKTCILILSYNQRYQMEKCLESIDENCSPDSYSLVIFDNASTDGVTESLKAYAAHRDQVTLVLSDENLGFAGGCNAAAKYVPEGQDILLLNNDTRLPANALFWLRMGLYAADDVGAVGGVQNYQSTPDQWVDVELPFPELYMEYGAKKNVLLENPCEQKRKLSGFALLLRHGLFERLGGFDEQFSPGYFEDDDLCFRIRESGYRLMVCHNAFIYHAGSQSFSKKPELLALFERNRQRFVSKWGMESWEADQLKAIDPSGIKLIVWDLDNTFWKGILSEEQVEPVPENMKLVRLAADKGIENSICSKNDLDPVQQLLESDRFSGMWEYFVFPSVDWTPKGGRLRQLLEDISLRPENVLFVDDELRNLREAHSELPDMKLAEPGLLPAFYELLQKYEGSDPEHKRLNQYRLLERKREGRKEAASNEEFLRASDICVTIRKDCRPFAGRIHELLGRTNQLNYTKERPSREELDTLLEDETYCCAAVQLKDNYGDYGLIGFYAMERVEPHKLKHFAFSCRVMGMGVEQYLWQKLGFPPVEVKGQVAAALKKEIVVDWIREEVTVGDTADIERSDCKIVEEENQGSVVDNAYQDEADGKERSGRKILLKGPCDIDGMIPYFACSERLELETNFVDSRDIVVAGSNNSIHLYEAAHSSAEELRRTMARAPFLCDADFTTYMFQDPYDAVVFSTLTDGHSGIYRDRHNGLQICFGSCSFDMTDPANWQKFITGEYVNHNVSLTEDFLAAFAEDFTFEGSLDPTIIVRDLKWMREKLPQNTKLILLLGSEIEAEQNTPEFAEHAPIYQRLNREIRTAFSETRNVELINITDYITGQDCFAGCTNHFSRLVYRRLAERLMDSCGIN